ncbi:hypothetical protein AMECASPLE_026032 [Ameca splendens]|uniref:MADS-box transcription factor, plant n=1 Tax=Ameca splendens TaxID=208324 RepID=A0ABV0YSZ6_9TELE
MISCGELWFKQLKRKNFKFNIQQIEEIQHQEHLHLRSVLEPDGKQPTLFQQRQDLQTPDLTSLQQRIQMMESFQKQLKLRSFLKGKEENVKLLITRLEQIKASSQAQNEDVRRQPIDEVQQQTSSERR